MKYILSILTKLKTLLGKGVISLTESTKSKRYSWMKVREEEDAFYYWAYGDAWVYHLIHKTSPLELLDAWNKLHGHKLFISQDEVIGESLRKMIRLYKEETNGLYSATA